jgi:hypothetical protein
MAGTETPALVKDAGQVRDMYSCSLPKVDQIPWSISTICQRVQRTARCQLTRERTVCIRMLLSQSLDRTLNALAMTYTYMLKVHSTQVSRKYYEPAVAKPDWRTKCRLCKCRQILYMRLNDRIRCSRLQWAGRPQFELLVCEPT